MNCFAFATEKRYERYAQYECGSIHALSYDVSKP